MTVRDLINKLTEIGLGEAEVNLDDGNWSRDAGLLIHTGDKQEIAYVEVGW